MCDCNTPSPSSCSCDQTKNKCGTKSYTSEMIYDGAGFGCNDLASIKPNCTTLSSLLKTFGDKICSFVPGHTIQDEGSDLPQQPKLNFIGAGVTATDNPGNGTTDVTIEGASESIWTEINNIPLLLNGNGNNPDTTPTFSNNPTMSIKYKTIGKMFYMHYIIDSDLLVTNIAAANAYWQLGVSFSSIGLDSTSYYSTVNLRGKSISNKNFTMTSVLTDTKLLFTVNIVGDAIPTDTPYAIEGQIFGAIN